MPQKYTPPRKKVEYKKFQETKLILPKYPQEYKVRRMAWLMANYHRLLETDPSAITYKQYKEALEDYVQMVESLAKSGLSTREGRRNARKRVDTPELGKGISASTEDGVGAPIPFGLGAGISTPDTAA